MASKAKSRSTAVVGGGVVGLSLAYELLSAGEENIVVLDRAAPGSGATQAAAGMLTLVSEVRSDDSQLLDFAREAAACYPDFVRTLEAVSEVSCDYSSEGTVAIALCRDDELGLEQLATTAQKKGLAHEWLSRDEVLYRLPHLSSRVTGGLFIRDDHHVDPRKLTQALVIAITKMGGSIETGQAVDEIDAANRGVELRLRSADGMNSRRNFEKVVICAGAWTGSSIRFPGRVDVFPVKGEVARLHHPEGKSSVVRLGDTYLVSRGTGELVIGATVAETGFDLTPSAGSLMGLLNDGREAIPSLDDYRFSEMSVGLRPGTRDQLPFIGPTPTRGLFVSAGHYRKGILLAPLSGRYLAALLRSGEIPAALEPFSPGRTGRISVNGEWRPLFKSTLKDALSLEISRPGVAIAINREILPKESWPTRVLRTGDEIEIVSATQGG